MQQSKAPEEVAAAQRMRTVQEAYALFRAKWGAGLPEQFRSTDQWDFARLRAATLAEGDVVAPVPAQTGGAASF